MDRDQLAVCRVRPAKMSPSLTTLRIVSQQGHLSVRKEADQIRKGQAGGGGFAGKNEKEEEIMRRKKSETFIPCLPVFVMQEKSLLNSK